MIYQSREGVAKPRIAHTCVLDPPYLNLIPEVVDI